MSRLAKQPILIPSGVEITINANVISVKGPKGLIEKKVSEKANVEVKDGNVIVAFSPESSGTVKSMAGTVASHVLNMIEGVTKGFEKKLILEGVGYKSEVKGKELVCALGFSHPTIIAIPEGLEVKSEKGNILISGIDKEVVGSFAAFVRSQKKPEPYKGKGFRYSDEVVNRKQGKKTV
ncbi:MAG: 50S ribosomal protein L6 [Candidatus Paceibacterota bacterium]